MTNNNRFWVLTCSFVGVFAFMLSLSSCSNDNKEELFENEPEPLEMVSYLTNVVPLIQTNCLGCHSAADPSFGAGHILEGYENLKVFVDDGRLINVLKNENGFSLMPPSGSLVDFDIALIEQWIDEGAEDN